MALMMRSYSYKKRKKVDDIAKPDTSECHTVSSFQDIVRISSSSENR